MLIFLQISLAGLLLVSMAMAGIWRYGIKLNNAGVVDIFWSLLVAFLGLFYVVSLSPSGPRQILAAVLYLLWAIRLSGHIFLRYRKHSEEEPRYRDLKNKWGAQANRKMLKFYFQQGLGAWFFSWPILFVALDRSKELSVFSWLGFLLWCIAVAGETAADMQLEEFKAIPSNRGKTCRQGLWNYSRHPNYFFEWLVWAAFFIYALDSQWGWISIICPIGMFHFLHNVTGVPLNEKQALLSRGEEYRRYQSEVSCFFPWFPKKQ